MSGYIKYFKNGGKNMSFLIKDDEVLDKYDKIWDVIKGKLGISFHSESFMNIDTYMNIDACITVDSVLRTDKKTIHKFI